ncbi:MAG: hypothetical protein L0Z70_03345 [Chloroflexi bacterium]|nr:hypothetical protein [Chloroflexota bacterium]
MAEKTIVEQTSIEAVGNWKPKVLLIGVGLGALVGAGAAFLLIQRAERQQTQVNVSAGEGVRLGLLVFGLLRQVAMLGEGEK